MANEVAILGVGMHKWGKWGKNFVEYGVKACLDALKDAGIEWTDVDFVSGADTVGYIPSHGLLGAAKSSMETLVHYLACELGPMGVTAVGVLPGYIDTDSIKMMTGPLYEPMKKVEMETHPLRQAATAEDAAQAIALLCLDEARWLNGQIVQNDGAGLFAMQGRFFQTAATGNSGSADSDAPIIGI